MEPSQNAAEIQRPSLPTSGRLVGIGALLWGVWIGAMTARSGLSGSIIFIYPLAVIAIHAAVLVGAVLFLRRKELGRQILIVGLWCSTVAVGVFGLFAAAMAVGLGGIVESVGGSAGGFNWPFFLLLMMCAILPGGAALSLHHHSIRDAMGPPDFALIRDTCRT